MKAKCRHLSTGDTCRASDNEDLYVQLLRIAELLEAQRATPFRVNAYRRAASTVAELPDSMCERFAAGGVEALEKLPAIGKSIASLIREYARTGRISLLERLEGEVTTEEVLASVPGLGPVLAQRVHDKLGIETLEELECACADGRLAAVRGFGPGRAEGIAAWVASRLGRRPTGRARPSVTALLSVDAEYRDSAAAERLPRIAPRRLNPEGRAWLPILHTRREGWEMTALFSNTARAHQLGRTHDWVVIHSERRGEQDQCTVVTERRPAGGTQRTIRGREFEVEAERETLSGTWAEGRSRSARERAPGASDTERSAS
jgi:DNA polymerase (family 10)